MGCIHASNTHSFHGKEGLRAGFGGRDVRAGEKNGRRRAENEGGIRHRYRLLNVLGRGSFGVLLKAETRSQPGHMVALKVFKQYDHEVKKQIADEVTILRDLTHENIVKCWEAIEDGPYFFVVMEYCEGGCILDRIVKQERFRESEVAALTKKLLSALAYCHGKGIAHRDLKPQHILYASQVATADVKLVDFGFAKKAGPEAKFETMLGTPNFVAPEIIEGLYSSSCDLWALGVILYYLLSGQMPFSAATTTQLFAVIKSGRVSFEGPVWEKVSDSGRDFVKQLLNPDENKRPTAVEAQKHEWFKAVKARDPAADELSTNAVESIKAEHQAARFKQGCIRILGESLSEAELNSFSIALSNEDSTKSAALPCGTIIDVFQQLHPTIQVPLQELQVEELAKSTVDYNTLITSALDIAEFLSGERLYTFYHYINTDDKPYVTLAEITDTIRKLNYDSTRMKEISAKLATVEKKDADCIKPLQFEKLMKSIPLVPSEVELDNLLNNVDNDN